MLLAADVGNTNVVFALIDKGEIKALVVVSDLSGTPLEPELIEALGKVELGTVILLEWQDGIPESVRLIPATAFSERSGTIINEDGRVQLLRVATELPRGIIPETDLLQDVLLGLGKRDRKVSAGGVFREIAQNVPALEGLDHRKVGALGARFLHDSAPSTATAPGAAQ